MVRHKFIVVQPHEDIFSIDFIFLISIYLREREREIYQWWEGIIDQLPPTCTLLGSSPQLGMCGNWTVTIWFMCPCSTTLPHRMGSMEGKWEGERHLCERATSTGCLLQVSYLQPRYVPLMGIEPETLWLSGQQSNHWATLARADIILAQFFIKILLLLLILTLGYFFHWFFFFKRVEERGKDR